MDIKRFDSGILSSNMYVIQEDGHAVVIDPARDTAPGEGLIIDLLIVTHEHYDHISGVNAWKEKYHAPLLCSSACAARLTDPGKNRARHFDAFCELQTWMKLEKLPEIDTTYACQADRVFKDEMLFSWRKHQFRLIEIPGHSPGGIGIYLEKDCFFSGDSLIKDCEIELRFPGGSRKQWLEKGEPRIKAVPKGTRIYPGHFASFILE